MKKKRIRWSASPSPDVVGYRLYWAFDGDVAYDSDFVDIGGEREIILPDGVPSLQNAEGEIVFGVSAVSFDGNESDLVRFTLFLDPTAPLRPKVHVRPASEGWEAPVNCSILVDDLNHLVIRDVAPLSSGQPGRSYDYFIDTHHIDEKGL